MFDLSALEPKALLTTPSVLAKRAERPAAVLEEPVVLFKRAAAPTAVLAGPVVLLKSTAAPMAVLLFAVLNRSAPAPVAVLKLPSVLLQSEYQPTAVFADAGGEAKKGVLPFCRVEPGIAAVRRRNNRLRSWQKPEAGEHASAMRSGRIVGFELNQWIHGSSFLFPARLILRLRVRKRRRT